MTVLFFGVLGSVSFLTVMGSLWIYRHLPDSWLCEYGEIPSEQHRTPNRCARPVETCAILSGILFMVMRTFVDRNMPGGVTEFLFLIMLSLILLPAVLSDLDYCIIPDQCCLAAAALALLNGLVKEGIFGLIAAVSGALVCGGMIGISAAFASFLARRSVMGMGDLKLLSVCGAAAAVSAETGVRVEAAISVFSGAVLLSALWFSFLLVFRKVKYGDARPLAPWIVLSTFLSIAWF